MISDHEPAQRTFQPFMVLAIYPLDWRLTCSWHRHIHEFHLDVGPVWLTVGW